MEHGDMLFIHYFLQIKQNFCISLDFVVAVAAHLLKKYKKLHEKSPSLNERHSNNLYFFQSECISLVINDRPINLRKEMLQSDE